MYIGIPPPPYLKYLDTGSRPVNKNLNMEILSLEGPLLCQGREEQTMNKILVEISE
jgi:hypothetical protein